MIEAWSLGSDTAEAAGLTITHRTPILALCRALLAAGHPDQPMVVRDLLTGRVDLHIPSIALSAGRTVKENPMPRFVKLYASDLGSRHD
jgi:hypothetical protein